MNIKNPGDPETGMQEWRASIVNGLLVAIAVVTLPAVAAIIISVFPYPDKWFSAIPFLIAEIVVIMLAVFRSINIYFRVGTLLLIGYLMAIANLARTGFFGSGFTYLLVMPILALILIGRRAGVFFSVISALLAVAFAILFDRGLITLSPTLFNSWIALSTTLMLLSITMSILILFYRFQERLIDKAHHAQDELLHAQALLEEQNASLERKVIERTEEIQQRNKILTALYEINEAASSLRDVQEFYTRIHHIMGELIYAKNFFIALYDETTGLLSFPYFVDEEDEPFPTQPLEDFHGLTSYMIRTGTPIRHGWDQFNDLVASHEAELVGTYNEDGIGTPLKAEGKIIGAIYVQSYTKGIHYTERDEEVLAFVAQHIAIALIRFRALESERQRITELAIINSVQSGLAADLDFQAIIDLVGDKLRAAFDTPNLIITWYDDKAALIHYLYAYEHGERLSIAPRPPHPGGILEKLIGAGQAAYLEYGGKKEVNPPVLPGTDACLSGVAIPIISSDRLLGVIQLENFEREHAYSQSELRLLTTIAASLGAALENVQLSIQNDQAIEALRQSEERYRLIAENSDDVIWTTDIENRLTYISPAVRKLRSVEPEEALQQTWSQVMPAESLKALMDEHSRVLPEIEQGKDVTIRLEVEQYRKDGSTVWIELSRRAMWDSAGRLTGFVGVSRDISARKAAEAELLLSNTQLAMAMDIARLASWEFDLARHGFIVNDQFYALHNTTAEGEGGYFLPVEIYLREFVHPADALLIEQQIAAASTPGNLISEFKLDQQVICRGGEVRDHMIRVIIDRDERGAIVKAHGVNQDITEQKRIEQALRESERRLADLINFLPLATLVIDRAGKVTTWNRAMEEMTGVKSENMLGKGEYEYALPFYGKRIPILVDLVFTQEYTMEERYKYIRRVGGILSAEAFCEKLGGNGRILLGFASALYGSDGQINGAIESIRDVTELRQAEAELKKAKEAAEAANRSKSAFLANMSHEIRTPMNAILGFAQLLQRDPDLSAQQRENLEVINRSGEHLLALINDILELSKIEAGRAIFTPCTFDLHRLLEDMEMMFRVRTEDKKLWLTVEKTGDVPRWVVTDEGKLRQILINLMGNAVKFTQEGGIGVRAGVQPGQGGKDNLLFEVEDTGPGISAEEIDNLFKVFEQTSSGIKMGGTGLGLALSRGFVNIMGGTVAVSSTIGKGSIFRFSIPYEAGREEQVERKEQKRRVIRLKPGQEEMRILIADDRETNRQFLAQMLSMVGFRVKEVVNGAEAVAEFQEWKPHIILMDMGMPVMDGYEATRTIKACAEGKNTLIIAITASAFQEDRQQVMAAGADGYLAKPFREADLFETIRQLSGINYLYEEEAVEEQKAAEDEALVWQEAVSALPVEVVRACREAAENADIFRLMELLADMSNLNSALTQRLNDLADRYEYDEILNLLTVGE